MEKLIEVINRRNELRNVYNCTYLPFIRTKENIVKINRISSFFSRDLFQLKYDDRTKDEMRYLTISGNVIECHLNVHDFGRLLECDMNTLLSKIEALS